MFAGLTRRRFCTGFALALILTSVSACNFDRFRGEGFRRGNSDWDEAYRPPGKEEDHAGFSSKAREIESHLGS